MKTPVNTSYFLPSLVLLLVLCSTASAQRFAGQYSFMTANFHYLCAEGGGGREVVANRTEPGTWETFTVFQLSPGKYAIRAFNGKYVNAVNGGGREVVADGPAISLWETFTLVQVRDNKYAIQAANGKYVSAERGGGREVVANRDVIGPWETFTLTNVGRRMADQPQKNGRNVGAVRFGTDERYMGRFIQTGQIWVELGDGDTLLHTFSEVNRDDWSIYLHDSSRNVSLQLDLHTRQVLYSDGSGSQRRPIYIIKGFDVVVHDEVWNLTI